MLRVTRSIVGLLAATCLVAGCEEDDPAEVEGPFDLVFAGDATYHTPHGGQDIMVALVSEEGTVLETRSGVVSGTADPAFSFTFEDALVADGEYQIHWWIDSNFNDGTDGECDAPPVDHQWLTMISDVANDVEITDVHDASDLTDVCATFDGG